jgi:hypothetical protein
MDGGEAHVLLRGRPTKVYLFHLRAGHSGAAFVMAFPRQTQPAFLEARNRRATVLLVDELGALTSLRFDRSSPARDWIVDPRDARGSPYRASRRGVAPEALPHARLGRPRPLHHPRQERRQVQQLERQRPHRIRHAGSDQTTDEEVSAAWTDHHRKPGPRRTYSSSGTRPPQLGRLFYTRSGSLRGSRPGCRARRYLPVPLQTAL